MVNPGIRISECRRRKGWTQAKLASRAGLAQANLSNIEKGKRDLTVSMLLRLARALEVCVSALIEDEERPRPFRLTRKQIEALAAAVRDPKIRTSSEIRVLAGLFRLVLPGFGRRGSVRKIQEAWARLKQRFSPDEIRGISQRIRDAGQRNHEKAAD